MILKGLPWVCLQFAIQSDLGLPSLSRPFWQATSVQNSRTFNIVDCIKTK